MLSKTSNFVDFSLYSISSSGVLSKIDNEDVQDIIRLVRSSGSYDLSDVEEALMPALEEIYDHGITFGSLVASCSFDSQKCTRE